MMSLQYYIHLLEQGLSEGRVYRLDAGYSKPVNVISNPSPPQARTLVESIRSKRNDIYLRGLMHENRVLIWDGWMLTHDDVRVALLPDVPSHSSDLTLFAVDNYDVVGITDVKLREARISIHHPGDYNPEASPFVQHVIEAIDATSLKEKMEIVKGIRVWVDPSARQLLSLGRQTTLRGTVIDGTLYAWKAYEDTHYGMRGAITATYGDYDFENSDFMIGDRYDEEMGEWLHDKMIRIGPGRFLCMQSRVASHPTIQRLLALVAGEDR